MEDRSMKAEPVAKRNADVYRPVPPLETSAGRDLRGLELAMAQLDVPDMIVARVRGPLSHRALQRATMSLQARHQALRARIERSPGARPRFHYARAETQPAPVVEIHDAADSGASWQRAVEHEAAHRFAAGSAPFRVLCIRGTDGASYVVLNAQHALVDGISLMRLMHELLVSAAQPSASLDTPAALSCAALPPTPAALEHFHIGVVGRVLAWFARRLVIRWQRHAADQLLFPVHGRLEPGARVETHCRFGAGDAANWQRVRDACRRHKVTVGGAYTAAVQFAAMRELRDLGAASPVSRGSVALPIAAEFNLRQLIDPAELAHNAIGLFSGGAEIGVRVPADVGFWALARRLMQRTRTQLARRAPLLLHQVLDGVWDLEAELRRYGIDYGKSGGAASALNVSNVGRWPYPCRIGALSIDELYGLSGALTGGPMHMFWLRSVNGRFCYNATSAHPAASRESADRLFAMVVDLMEHCGDTARQSLSLAEFLDRPRS
jgi:hypothetical protein